MTSRILPPEEWPRLAGTELETIWPELDRERASVVVVEDGDARIVGCWALFPIYHVEGLWLAPGARKKSSVARRLWEAMRCTARQAGARTVATAACSEDVRNLLAHVGALPLPGDHFVMRV